jgi:anti-sigma-K factor RskA
MNMPIEDGNNKPRYAKSVLGVLGPVTRAEAADEMQVPDEAATVAAPRQRRLKSLVGSIREVAPAPRARAWIHHALQPDAPVRPTPRTGPWDNLQLWCWLGVGASARSDPGLSSLGMSYR